MSITASKSTAVSCQQPGAIVVALLRWYRRQARPLPWRRTRDPYAIWISEVMLQQTQVQTVIPYWERWMRAFPSVEALARARVSEVLRLWEGLGYYSRARNLHLAARRIRSTTSGRFPRRFDQILALPGVGRYTAGAIASIAFNQPHPVVDGNVARVLARLTGTRCSLPRAAPGLWQLASVLVEQAAKHADRRGLNCADLNQALMELGALVCAPRAPDCAVCPLAGFCDARKQGLTNEIPSTRARPRSRSIHQAAFVIQRHNAVLLRRRPTGGVNAGLWEFPGKELKGHVANPRAAATALFGSGVRLGAVLLQANHSITRYRIRLRAYHLHGVGETSTPSGCVWCNISRLEQRAFSAAHRKIARALQPALRSRPTTSILRRRGQSSAKR